MADILNTSQDADIDVGSSQFAELLKPIRELTKQHCWNLNIAVKLDEYVHYIKDLDIEVNVNGEKMKLDFAKAAMVVQNSVHIYSQKVEDLWILLQEVIDSLRSHSSGGEGEEGATGGPKTRRNPRKRHQKGEVNLLEVGESKYRKIVTQNKKKGSTQPVRKIQILPYEILQLEEAVGSSNPIKIKLYTMVKDHLGYPSDFRANFPFDQKDFFLQIAPKINNTILEHQQNSFPAEEGMEVPCESDVDMAPPDFGGEGSELQNEDYGVPEPCLELGDDPLARDETAEEIAERMQLRARETPPVAEEKEAGQNLDPWQSLEIYLDMSIRKPVGTQPTTKLPSSLQNKRKRKEVGKEAAPGDDEVVPHIHEFLVDSKFLTKKPANKICQPEGEYWEEFVFYSKSVGAAAKKHLKTQSAGNVTVEDLDEVSYHEDRGEAPEPDDRPDCSFNDDPRDDFHFDGGGGFGNEGNEDRDADDAASKDFYEILQQQMAEYMATAKAFVSSTESTRRVQAWHDMIRPRLLEAESRRDFDIHEYGSQIISVFGSDAPIGSRTRFSQVVDTLPKNEVARYFLATLQLANAYNVEIESENNSMSVDAIQLKLLSRDRHHEHIDEFR